MPFEPSDNHDKQFWIPEAARARIEKDIPVSVALDNRTDIPDEQLERFVEDTAMFGFGQEVRYLNYASEGTMMARSKWRPPRNVIEEIALARDMAERDDDVAAAMQAMIAAAFHGGYANQHEDEQIEHTFEEMSEDVGLMGVLQDMYRELLIASQITTVTLFMRATYDLRPENVSRVIKRSVAAPLMAVLPAERIRVIGNDLFGGGQLAFIPEAALSMWLREFWNESITPARKRQMRLEDPIAAALFTGRVTISPYEFDTLAGGAEVYLLNPDMTSRSTFPKGTWKYPRPLLTRDQSLLEAKRLLNVIDHALLQGGINYIVVAKKGDEKKPATQGELANLQGLMQRASRSGVMIGDHRINLEIVQPDMSQMLHPDKRRMLGRKLSQALLRVPEFGSDETGMAVATFTELAQAVITNDRNLVVGHVHRYVWRECMKRNQSTFTRTDRPTLWTPKIILQGLDFWTQYLLKLYDRGDLPRKYMVEFGGYDYNAVKAQKQREVENGHDEIFAPPLVPYSSPNQGNKPGADPNNPYHYGKPGGPNDNGGGRPAGSPNGNGAPPDRVRPSRVVRRTPGETVRASWDEEQGQVVRIGEITERVLEEHPDAVLGRLTAAERRALETDHTSNEANVIVVPVNVDTEIEDVQAVRLGDGFSMLTGNRRHDGAVMARAFCFREPRFSVHEAEDMVVRWGFPVRVVALDFADGTDTITCPSCGADSAPDAAACATCGFDGPPFSVPPSQLQPQPIALHVTVNGNEVGVTPPSEPPKEDPSE